LSQNFPSATDNIDLRQKMSKRQEKNKEKHTKK